LQLEVQNGSAEVVTTLNVGSGYAAGDELDIGNGIKVSLSMGDLNDSEAFEVDAFAETDTSGFLAVAGMNTFFSGDSASNMSVCSEVAGTPGLVATALGADMTDNVNSLRLAGVRDEAISSLDSMTVGQFYRRLITDLGQELSVKGMGHESIEVIIQNLSSQQSEISGVNINEEVAKLLVFEQMFQAMAKYISTIQSSMASIMELI
jgi:flagellar hook-associated protein 1 FlgK